MGKKGDKFFYPYAPRIKSIYNTIFHGHGKRIDFEDISKNFVLSGSPVLNTPSKYEIDETLTYLSKEKCYIARRTGFVYFDNNAIRILPYINTNHKKLICFIIIPISDLCKKPLTETLIRNNLQSLSLDKKIDIANLTKEYTRLHKRSGGYRIIQQGTEMIPDREHDILIEDRFKINNENFSLLEGRRILSTQEIRSYHPVDKGEKVGTYMRLIQGKEGIDVLGQEIPRSRIDSFYKVGDGLEKTPQGDIKASKKGVLRINKGGELTVKETQIIDQDIKNNLTLDVDHDVIITGRIYNNIKVKIKGNLVIIGGMEGIQVDCGGDLFLTNGISSQSVVNVDSDCYCQFITHSQMTVGGQIWVGQYILNSEIKSKKDILARTHNFGEIVGGRVESENGHIETNIIGSISGTHTFLKAGKSAIKLESVRQRKIELAQFSKEIFILEQKIKKSKIFIENMYDRWKRDRDSLSASQQEQFKRNIFVFKDLNEEKKRLDEKIKESEDALIQDDSSKQANNRIKVFDGVFWGVTVQIRGIKYSFAHDNFGGFILSKNPTLFKIDSHPIKEKSTQESDPINVSV